MQSDIHSFIVTEPNFSSIIYKNEIHKRCTSTEELFEQLRRIFDKKLISDLKNAAQKEIEICNANSISTIDYYSPLYPSILKEIYNPPLLLFYKGNAELLNKNLFAVVGTRKPSSICKLVCGLVPKFISKIQNSGIVSGLALGIDEMAMNSALDEKFPVVGIMGTGFDKKYPTANKLLYQKMINSSNAMIVTEKKWKSPVGKWSFPMRNRIITGLSKSLLVVEAPLESGAMSSAAHAISQNRDIFVFDHPDCFYNEGGRNLILQGAKHLSLQDIKEDSDKIFHASKLNPNSYEKVSGLLANISRQEMAGSLLDRGGGFFEILDV
jgi:DNA processing protein